MSPSQKEKKSLNMKAIVFLGLYQLMMHKMSSLTVVTIIPVVVVPENNKINTCCMKEG